MRRILASSLVLFSVMFIAAATCSAQSPHFLKTSASIQSNGDLVVSFKEAGLGSNQNIDYTATANATVTYGCINGGGRHPKATNKETVSGPVSGSGTFSSGQNGTISQSLTITPPGPGNFSCPSGQGLVLGTVTYSNVTINDTTNGVSEPVGTGTFSVTVASF